ncbi:hypothetical protein [Aliikangiella sp. IMCC44359]|uniref:hypothetical protein n=1 Tax=Aliikangiella sp. IMCC44359 TaxID=3459125 RepID=UPI00403A9FB8
MIHWDKDELLLYYYGELEQDKLEALEKALESSTELQQTYAEICEFLDEKIDIQVPAPSDNLKQNIMAAIYQVEQQKSNQPHFQEETFSQKIYWWQKLLKPNFGLATGISFALVVSIFFIGRWSAKPDMPVQAEQSFTTQASQRVLFSSISHHLESSDRLFTLVSNGNGDLIQQIDSRRQAIEELVALNRLYRRLAENSGDKQLVYTLMQMEAILIELDNSLPNQSRDSQYVELNNIKQRIYESDLLFKLRVTNKNIKRKII